jgi:putative sigma-54 modulation protein
MGGEPMEVRFVTRNVEVPDELKEYMEKKLGKLEKFFDRILDTQVEISFNRGMHVVEITSDVNGVIMRGEDYAPDVRKAFDKGLKNIERQVKRHKSYLKDKARMKSHEDLTFNIEGFLNEISPEQETTKKEDVVKVKKFPLRPMSSEEAAMQMDLLGHSFFMFKDAENGSISVIYRRKDGGFGILVPEE